VVSISTIAYIFKMQRVDKGKKLSGGFFLILIFFA